MIIVDKITLTTFFIILKILIKNKFEKVEIELLKIKIQNYCLYILFFN